ncbi:MAG TPA: quinolinate synthase NadA [Solirubrobacteraceae bacterium]|nr:quinolinate synthase NadA [Solirubrobacteraceae bacterium]
MARVIASEQAPAPGRLELAQIEALPAPRALGEQERRAMQEEVRALAREHKALILAHNYQLPEVQEVADFVGDSLALSRQAARASEELIVFCGVHFMAETASVLCPQKTVLLPDPRAGCSLASSIDEHQLEAWRQEHPRAIVVMYVNTSAAVKALTDYCCTSANAVDVVRHVLAEHGEDVEILFGPDMWLGAYVEREIGRPLHVWDGECHVHAGIRPDQIESLRASHPGAELLVHPECGCTTSVMEYLAAGDIDGEGVHMLSTGGMLRFARHAAARSDQELVGIAASGDPSAPRPVGAGGSESGAEVIVATEVGMLYGLQQAAPGMRFIPANPRAACAFMKVVTLPRLLASLRKLRYEVRVPADVAARARIPIERMVAIG